MGRHPIIWGFIIIVVFVIVVAIAGYIYKSSGGYDIAAFLAHQSIEKLCKAMLAIKGEKIPKTHYIDELAHELKLEAKLINDISELTVDYTFSRYPDVAEGVPYEEYTEEIAQEKVAIARKIFSELKSVYDHLLKG